MATATRTKQVNEQYERITTSLRAAGYQRSWQQSIPETRSNVECWLGERGALLVQVWDRAGVDVYHTGGIPVEWNEFATWLGAK